MRVVCFNNLLVSIICMLSIRMKTPEPAKFPLHLPSCDIYEPFVYMECWGLYLSGFVMYYSYSMAGTWAGAWGECMCVCVEVAYI